MDCEWRRLAPSEETHPTRKRREASGWVGVVGVGGGRQGGWGSLGWVGVVRGVRDHRGGFWEVRGLVGLS